MKPYHINFSVKDKQLPHLSPVMSGKQQCYPGYTFGPVIRRYYIIEYVLRGRGEYIANGRAYTVEAGSAFVIKPYETHILRADKTDPWEYVWIGFTTDMRLPRTLAEGHVFEASAVKKVFEMLADGAHEERTTADYATAAYEIFARLYDAESTAEKPQADAIDRAIAIIREEYATVTVNELSQRLFMNRSYFGTLFKKKTGMSPKQYIDNTRLSTASMMLCELGYTVTQAALATGYADIMSFSRMYKKHFGVSPRTSADAHTKGKKTIVLR